MSTDLEKLVVQLSADIKGYEKALIRASGVTNKQFSEIERRARQMNKNLDGILAKSLKGLAAPLAGIGAALGVQELLQLTNVWTDLKSRVDLAAGSVEKGTDVMGRLGEMASRTYSSLEQTAESYLLNARTLTELGYSTKTQLDYTEALNNALVISGAKGDRAASVMDALSKAMALGKLSGDDLNTVISTGGRVAEALAASMGVSTVQLRKLGMDGKITRKELVGITSQLSKLRVEADGMQATVGDAIVLLKNALLQYVGGGDAAVGISKRLAEAIQLVAANFEVVADTALKLAFVITSALLTRAIGGMIAVIPNGVAALATLTAALRAGTLTAAGFSAALGPIGLAAGAAAAALYLLSSQQTEAEKAASVHQAMLKELKFQIDNVDYANGAAVASTRQKIEADIKAAEVALARAKAERELAAAIAKDEISPGMQLYPAPAASEADQKAFVNDNPMVKDRQAVIDQVSKQIEDLKKAQSNFEDYASGRKKPQRETDHPINIPGDDKDGKSKKKRDNEFERQLKSITDRTAATVAETEAQRQVNPLINDYNYAVEKARAQQDLLNAAQKAGVKITPELKRQVEGVAEQFALATVEAGKLTESQDRIKQKAEEMADFQKDLSRGIVDGFIQGKKAADIFADALSKVGNKFLDLALSGLFDTKSSGGMGFNLLSIFGLKDGGQVLKLAGGGGVNGPGGPRSDKVPAMLSNGEFVVNAKATKQHRMLLEAINQGKALRLADGGMATNFRAPRLPNLQAVASQGQGFTYAPSYQIDATGAQPGTEKAIRAELDRRDQQFRKELPGLVNKYAGSRQR